MKRAEAVAAALAEVDAMGAKLTVVDLAPGWRAVLGGVGLPPHHGHGATPLEAIQDALRFARAMGVRPIAVDRPRRVRRRRGATGL